jgi:hypothetical protein
MRRKLRTPQAAVCISQFFLPSIDCAIGGHEIERRRKIIRRPI